MTLSYSNFSLMSPAFSSVAFETVFLWPHLTALTKSQVFPEGIISRDWKSDANSRMGWRGGKAQMMMFDADPD